MPKEKGKRRSGPTRGSTCGRLQRGIEQMPAADVGESSTTPSSTAGVNYADLSMEVLHLLLAQRNLALSGSRDTLLCCLADHDGAEVPAASSADPRPSSTPEYSSEYLRSLASNLVPLVRDVLAQQNRSPPTMPPQPPSLPSFPMQNAPMPPLDLGNPSQVASLLLSQPSTSSSPLDVSPSLPKRLEEQILKGEFVDFSLLLPGNSDHPSFAPIRLSVEGDQAMQLFAYQRIIREASQKLKVLTWYAYDIDFRKLAAKNPALNWGERHLQLWLDKFTGLARQICFVCGGADHMSALFPQGLKVAGQAGFPTKESFAGISTEVSHVLPLRVRSNTAAIDQTDCGEQHGTYTHDDTSAKRVDDTLCRRKHK
ncbi:Hypothetical predicted protein [Paramuricea clavata]|uniref:Uncharacterized protein n=1 Tax=Paramuricea clavata TaxID=317549 RepID=A0A6S7JRD2_PARCT|nr:Hypothetical predicted protein [Paramuricea clavata]